MHRFGTPASPHRIGEDQSDAVREFLPAIRRLARKVAKSYGKEGLSDDLVNAGVVGLLEVLEKYEPGRATLQTFAHLRIKGAMIDELRSRDWFPRSIRARVRKIEEVNRKLEREMGRQPEEEETAREMNLDPDKYAFILKNYGNLSIVSLEDVGEEVEKNRDWESGYPCSSEPSPEGHAEANELRTILYGAVASLSERQRTILRLYYQEDMNMKEVASCVGVSEARVSQIHSQTIAELRPLVGEYWKE